MHVLIVEYKKYMAAFVSGGLRKRFHRVDIGRDGSKALDFARLSINDAIFLAIRLASRGGFAFIVDSSSQREKRITGWNG